MAATTKASIVIDAPLPHVFATAAAIDPRELIRPHGPLPGIDDVSGHDAPWTAPGQHRTYRLSDGSSVDEELTALAEDESFSYRVSNFTGAFAPLVREAQGDWRFTAHGEAQTGIDWTYAFTPTGALAAPLVGLIVKLLWTGYMSAALARVKDKAEHQHHG